MWIQLTIMGLIIIAVNSMKHWAMLILPHIVKVETELRSYDTTFYITLNYMCFFYGLLMGSWVWSLFSNRISNAMAIFISLLLMGVMNYLQSLNTSLSYLCAFRFIIGAVTNIQKMGKSFVHEFIGRKNRQQAFQVENASYVLGSIVAPFLGYYLYHTTSRNFTVTALIISVFILVLAGAFYIVFVSESIKPNAAEDEEENIGIVRIPTMVAIDFRSMLIHCFYSNVYAKYLILTYIINSACFHVDFVLTSMYFLLGDNITEPVTTKRQLAEANLIGSIPSIFVILFLYKIVPDIMSYKSYILATIMISAITTLSTPLVRYYLIPVVGQGHAKALLCTFYGVKMLFNYYIYTNALVKEINTSVFKVYRSNIMNIVTIVKMLSSAMLFNLTSTIMYIFIRREEYRTYEPYNHFVPFMLLTFLQFTSLYLFQKSRFKKKDIF